VRVGVDLTPVQYPEKSQKSKHIKIYIASEESLLLHAGKEARPERITPLNCHNCSTISHWRKTHNNHKRGFSNPQARTFLHGGKVQTARTSLPTPVETSDKNRQLLKHGGRCCVCLHENNSTGHLSGVVSTPFRCDRVFIIMA